MTSKDAIENMKYLLGVCDLPYQAEIKLSECLTVLSNDIDILFNLRTLYEKNYLYIVNKSDINNKEIEIIDNWLKK